MCPVHVYEVEQVQVNGIVLIFVHEIFGGVVLWGWWNTVGGGGVCVCVCVCVCVSAEKRHNAWKKCEHCFFCLEASFPWFWCWVPHKYVILQKYVFTSTLSP